MRKILLFLMFSPLLLKAESVATDKTDFFVKSVSDYKSETATTEEKEKIVQAALAEVENIDVKYTQYWKAVFLTFKCELKDKGRLIPFCIISDLSEIKELLNESHQNYPEYYHYAPARTLGIMYYKMPAITGGSNKKAKQYLQEAYDGDSEFSENKRWLDEVSQ